MNNSLYNHQDNYVIYPDFVYIYVDENTQQVGGKNFKIRNSNNNFVNLSPV